MKPRSQARLGRAHCAGLLMALIATLGSARQAVAQGSAPKVISTELLTFTGMAFTPKTLGVGELTFTGTGLSFSPKTLTVGELTFSGVKFAPKTLSTAPLVFTGLGEPVGRAPH